MINAPKVVRVLPLRDQVVESLLEAMHQGKFPAGSRLTEEAVGEFLGVSRTPVREALGILAQRGIISRRAGGGFVVPSPGAKNIDDSFQLRQLLEPFAIRQIVAGITDSQINELRTSLDALKAAVEKGAAAESMQANLEFRRKLFSYLDNEPLTRAIAQVTDHVQLIGMLTMNDAKVRKILLARHERILKAVRSRSADAAEKAVFEYLEAARGAAREALPTVAS